MARSIRGLRLLLGLAAACAIAIGSLGSPWLASAADPALPAWDGGIDLYRRGTFTTQKSWLWCTAAAVQIVRNIVDEQEDHSTTGQRRYFNWMRERNRYTLPLSAGVDPQGWTAGLRQFVDDRYRLVASRTFESALGSAVKRLRLTSLPVALAVSHGNHGWILTGFTATADPATTSSFKVTSVRVVGPLYGLQSRNGYDMRPDTRLTPTQLKRYFTPWRYAPQRMVWDGRYVSIQPVPVAAAASSAAATSSAAAAAPPVAASPSAGTSSALRSAVASAVAAPVPAASVATVQPRPTTEAQPAAGVDRSGPPAVDIAVLVLLAAGGAMIVVVLAGRLLGDSLASGAGRKKVRVPR